MSPPLPARPGRGILWMLLQCLVFSTLSLATQHLARALPVAVVFCLTNAVAFAAMVPWVIRTRGRALQTSTLHLYLLRAAAAAAGLCAWFYALKVVPITLATAISYTTPLFTCVLAVVVLKERLRPTRVVALIVGFAGAMWILRPGGTPGGAGVALALLSSILWASCDIIIKRQLRSDGYGTQIVYMALLMMLFTAPIAIWQWQAPTLEQWSGIAVIGGLLLLNFHALFRAYHHAELTVVMPFDFSRLAFTSVMAYLLFDERLRTTTAAGAAVVMLSTAVLARLERGPGRVTTPVG
jgi:drug/metabolite transporter (DMT)-like permease